MKDYPNVRLIGIGHKARSGKDTTANMIMARLKNVEIIHWADCVYEEAKNNNSLYPLIKKEFDTANKTYYSVLADKETGKYKAISDTDDEFLHKIFTEREITEYWGMVGKDPKILQFWGTNFRRRYFGKDYWVNLTVSKIIEMAESVKDSESQHVIIIPDTRFKNEADAIKNLNGLYIKVVRTDNDGNIFIADDRDPLHPSECDLDNYHADFTLEATNVQELSEEVTGLLNWIN